MKTTGFRAYRCDIRSWFLEIAIREQSVVNCVQVDGIEAANGSNTELLSNRVLMINESVDSSPEAPPE
jgi:hypothetical protein